jgi:hypothetical protein
LNWIKQRCYELEYATLLSYTLLLDEPKTMNTEKQGGGPGPWILFPEIIGISVLALLLPLPLVHLLLSGHALAGIAGFALWFAALFFTGRFIRRRQYGFAYFPMLAMVGLYFMIQKLCQ